ncbi:MAG: AsmA-like C-terminal region-containing protein [Pseudomonadota bacterium]
MSDDSPETPPRPARRRPWRWVLVLLIVLITVGFAGVQTLVGRSIALPAWVTAEIEEQLNAGLGDSGATLGQSIVEFDGNGAPRVLLRNVGIRDARGVRIATLNEVGAALSLQDVLRGEVAPSTLNVSGAQITVRRSVDGAFTLSFGEGATPAIGDMARLLDLVDATFDEAPLRDISRIEARDLTITLEDARSGRVWQVTDGALRLVNDADSISITVTSEVFNGTEDLADVQLSFLSTKGSTDASVGIQFENAAAPDIALQSPALSYLGVLDAPVSGAIRSVFGSDGSVERLAATLEIDSGALRPAEGARPVPFNSAQVYLEFDPADQKIVFSELSLQSDAMQLLGEGHAYLRDAEEGWPQTLLGQMRFEEIALTPEGMFDDPVLFDAGVTDFRLRLDPFEVDLGQSVLIAGDDRMSAKGQIGADDEGWRAFMDLDGDQMTTAQLLGLWPAAVVPETRTWLAENVKGGVLRDISAALRLSPGAPPRAGLSYDFEDATVRYMPHMPEISGGAGHAALIDGRYAMRLEQGQVRPAGQLPLDFAGSTLAILDVSERVPLAELNLQAKGPLASLLTALDNRPFRILEKSGRTANLASAEAEASARVVFRLAKDVKTEDVDFDVTGTLREFTSTTLVPGRTLTGNALDVRVRADTLEVAGAAALDGLPIEAVWRQSIAQDDTSPSRVDARVPLNQRFIDTFGITLPPGTVSGEAEALVQLEIPREGPVAFDLNSDLRGAVVRIADLGWTKPRGAVGALSISGSLGPEAQIDSVRLSGPGFQADGTVTLGPEGVLVSAEFDRVQAGDWLDAPVTLTGRGRGLPPAITMSEGRLDLRNLPDLPTPAAGQRVPMELSLDEVILADGIALRPFQAQLEARGGLNGEFQAQINGRTAVNGALVPQRGRTAIRVLSDNAGAVFRDAGLFRSLAGGEMDLILTPRVEAEGFDGRLSVGSARLRDQPAIADLLDAISVVGVIDQLQGPGILFNSIDGRFTLTPDTLTLTQGSAVGASLGLSLDGTYDLAAKRLNMQGVISPIYILNAIGQVFTRRGEGLFGFTFRMTGNAEDPRVSVNPLSILAPGMLREMLRGAPPGSEAARRQQIPTAEELRGDD